MGIPIGLSNVNINGLDLAARDAEMQSTFLVDTVDGWGGKPKPALTIAQKPRSGGGWAGTSQQGPRHIALAGWIVTDNPLALLGAQDALNAAFPRGDALMTVTELGVSRWVMARVEDELIITRKSRLASQWSAQVIALDPRKFGAAVSGSAFLPSTTGGLTVPFTVPFAVDAVTVSGQVSLFNPGNTAGPVSLRVDGPCVGPVVTHVSSGLSLVFSSSLVLGAGEWLDVDMEAHSVLANGQASRSGWVTSRGWSAFDPGANTWAFTAAEHDPASKLTVTAIPSWE